MRETDNPGTDRLALLQTFVRIVEAGSISAAARRLGTTQPTASRRLQSLERMLGLRLLQRSTHRMTLTEDGERCFAHAKALLDNWGAMASALGNARDEPEGLLRVVAPHAFGQGKLIAPLADYLRRYPRMRVEWLLYDRGPDFVAEGVDCAIQVGEVSDPSVIAVKLAEVPRIVIGAPGLLAGRAPPRSAAELAALPWLSLRTYYRDAVELVRMADGVVHRFEIRPRLSTDSLYALCDAVRAGLGVALVSAWLVRPDVAEGRLLHLAPQWQGEPLPVYLAYPYAPFYPARLRCFLDTMRQAMPVVLA
ncbi:LysR family transcriptional regulator [Bordetella sp. 2513F-2]